MAKKKVFKELTIKEATGGYILSEGGGMFPESEAITSSYNLMVLAVKTFFEGKHPTEDK